MRSIVTGNPARPIHRTTRSAAIAMAVALAVLMVTACGEEFGEGTVWATNELAVPVLIHIRPLRGLRDDTPVGAGRIWRIDAASQGLITRVNSGWIEVLQYGTCDVLRADAARGASIHIWMRRDGLIGLNQGEPENHPPLSRQYPEVPDCSLTP